MSVFELQRLIWDDRYRHISGRTLNETTFWSCLSSRSAAMGPLLNRQNGLARLKGGLRWLVYLLNICHLPCYVSGTLGVIPSSIGKNDKSMELKLLVCLASRNFVLAVAALTRVVHILAIFLCCYSILILRFMEEGLFIWFNKNKLLYC